MRPLAKTGVALLLTLVIAYVLAVVALSLLTGRNVITVALEDAWLALFTGGAVSIGLFVLFLLLAHFTVPGVFWLNY